MRSRSQLNLVEERLKSFDQGWIGEAQTTNMLVPTLTTWLIAIGWEGTPDKLSDFIVSDEKTVILNFEKTLFRLGYSSKSRAVNLYKDRSVPTPCFIDHEDIRGLVMGIEGDEMEFLDPYSEQVTTRKIPNMVVEAIYVDSYSRIFREPPPETVDRTNWLKYAFVQYKKEINILLVLSLLINLFGLVTPFYIMSIYTYAIGAGSISTLHWIAMGACIAITFEFVLKSLRLRVLSGSGRMLSEYISYSVFSKLIWIPYRLIKSAGIQSQIARIKDLDNFRSLVTDHSTMAYLDLPFIFIFILALLIAAGSVAAVTMVGILVFIIFGFYAQAVYRSKMMSSSKASRTKQDAWYQLLSMLPVIKSLPLGRILKMRFDVSNAQAAVESSELAGVQGTIADSGAFLTQMVGIISIIVSVEAVWNEVIPPDAMLAMVMLVWKALGPLQSIYNTIIRMKELGMSANQINRLMTLDDERSRLNNAIPIEHIKGQVKLDNVTFRYPGTMKGVMQIAVDFEPGEIITLYGPSGSGKSVITHILAGLHMTYQGKVLIDGYNLQQIHPYEYRNLITYMPQDVWVYDATLRQNFMIAANNITDAEMLKSLDDFDLNEWFPKGLDTQLDRNFVTALPGGIRSRLTLAIALVKPQGLIVMDDPGLSLDQDAKAHLRSRLSDLAFNSTIVIATRNPELLRLSNKCLLLDEMGAQKFFGPSEKVIATL